MFCFVKEIDHNFKVKIISMKAIISVPTPCYNGWWFSFKGGPLEFHKL
jgi:hypothetical protein